MKTQFQVKVSLAVRNGLQRELAGEFEVSESTVWRWAEGTAKPHPKVQAQVLKHLEDKLLVAAAV